MILKEMRRCAVFRPLRLKRLIRPYMLSDELELFDGKHTAVLERILSKHRQTNSLVRDLVLLVGEKETNIQTGATWLMKRLAENHVPFSTEHLIALFGLLPGAEQ